MKKSELLYEKWFEIPDKIRFLVIGGVNAGISYIIFILAVLLLGDKYYQICAALQWVISSFFSFTNQKIFVFRTKGNWVREYLKCCTTWLVSYLMNALLLEALVKYCDLNVYIAQIRLYFQYLCLLMSYSNILHSELKKQTDFIFQVFQRLL